MKLLGVIFFALLFTKCASLQLEENPPFKIKSATYSNWVGGMPGSGGIDLFVYYESSSVIAFDSIYFKGRKTKAQLKKDKKGTSLFGKFYVKTKNNKADMQLHKEAKKEYGNKVPKKEEVQIPFELNKNEAIITYKQAGKIKYYKVENIKKGKRIMMK